MNRNALATAVAIALEAALPPTAPRPATRTQTFWDMGREDATVGVIVRLIEGQTSLEVVEFNLFLGSTP